MPSTSSLVVFGRFRELINAFEMLVVILGVNVEVLLIVAMEIVIYQHPYELSGEIVRVQMLVSKKMGFLTEYI